MPFGRIADRRRAGRESFCAARITSVVARGATIGRYGRRAVFYSPQHCPSTRQPVPGERLAEFVRPSDGAAMRAEIRDHGDYGVEAQCFADGEFELGRRFPSRELAIAWAGRERAAIEHGEDR